MRHVSKHINPATVLALVALVFAVTGGAYAASGGGGNGGGGRVSASAASSHASAAAKKKKKTTTTTTSGKPGPRGPAGPAGPAGAAGPTGPAGAAGAKGETGTAGSNGSNGASGSNGQSVTSTEKSSGAIGTCKEGGSEFVSASGKTYACNGKKGEPGVAGPEGSPWTVNGALPAEKAETGTWGFDALGEETPGVEEGLEVPISFTIPLPGEECEISPGKFEKRGICESHVHIIEPGEEGTPGKGCDKGSSEKPEAEPGNLCIYLDYGVSVSAAELLAQNLEAGENGAGLTGAVLTNKKKLPKGAWAKGEWIVRAAA